MSRPSTCAASISATTAELAEFNGRTDALNGREARPGCPGSPRGRAYMRGYIAGAAERGEE